ncbi:MAG: carbohydrate kinase family protein, partial [Promethearchaeota archaeon]
MSKTTQTSSFFDIIVIGAVGIDTNIYFYTNKIDFDVEANYTKNLDYIGQAGGYTARGFAQLGYKTAFIGHVGVDHTGDLIRRTFLQDGINIEGLGIDSIGTKRSVNFMYPDGRRKNFYDGKGHMDLVPDLNLFHSILQRGKIAHFNLMNWSRKLLPIAREMGLTISVDLQDIVNIDDQYRQDFIRSADILFLSAVNYHDPTPIIDGIRARNKKEKLMIIIGRGKEGCIFATQTKIQFYPSVNFPNHPVIDTNGAGDGLAVGFLSSYLLEGFSIEDSVLRGQIVARYTCEIKASTENLITRPQLEDYFIKMK